MFLVFTRYPELDHMREFRNVEALVRAYRNGGDVYLCRSLCSRPVWVNECRVLRIDHAAGDSAFVVRNARGPDELLPLSAFIGAPVNAAFSTLDAASHYFDMAVTLFYSDAEWRRAHRVCLETAVARACGICAH